MLDDDIVIDEDDRARTKKPKISKMDQERHRRIEQVTKSEKEKLEKQQREKKRREKNKVPFFFCFLLFVCLTDFKSW